MGSCQVPQISLMNFMNRFLFFKIISISRYLGQDEDVQMREKFEDMDLDMDEVMERIEKANGKLKALESNHDMIKKKLAKMASIITGMTINYILINTYFYFRF